LTAGAGAGPGPVWLTAELPGSGGRLKTEPEDFRVEELPAYLPSGEGEHLYLWIEKRGHDTAWVAKALAHHVGLPVTEIGYAGMKDRHAVTRQLFSLPARVEAKLADFAAEGVTVHWAKRHGNKLRSGHLKGNRFEIRIRGATRPEQAEPILRALQQRGVPNYFGEQRFGRARQNAEFGKLLIRGERLPARPDRFQRKLYLSAFQSELFNRALAERISAGTFARALAGDVMKKLETGGEFVCEDPVVDQPRVDAFELSPAGPMFGPEMTAAQGGVAEAERRLLEAEGVTLSDFQRGRGETQGARRPYRLPLRELSVTREGDDVRVAFELPRGSYATVVLDEVMKLEDTATAG
jgi:tRNA pseudouridine13 synthase